MAVVVDPVVLDVSVGFVVLVVTVCASDAG